MGGSRTERLWSRPSVSILGIDAPGVDAAANKLVGVARTKVSLRIAPGDDAANAMNMLVRHLEANISWGASVTVTTGRRSAAFRVDAQGPAFDAFRRACVDAWGCEFVHKGEGGSVPIAAALADAFPGAALLLTGVQDPASNAHAEKAEPALGRLREVLRFRGLAARLPWRMIVGHLVDRTLNSDTHPSVMSYPMVDAETLRSHVHFEDLIEPSVRAFQKSVQGAYRTV